MKNEDEFISGVLHRRCKKCRTQLPLNDKFFYTRCNGKYFRHDCTECIKLRGKRVFAIAGVAQRLWMSRRDDARKNGVPFTIKVSDVVIPDMCPVLGTPMRRPSIDKIIPELGYVPHNVRVISMRANRIKSDATYEELARIAEYVRRSTISVMDIERQSRGLEK